MIGTTPTHLFHCSVDPAEFAVIRAVYKQNGKEILRKNTEDFRTEGQVLSVTLTQEETFLFDHAVPVSIQLRIKTYNGKVIKSNIMTLTPSECFDCEVL